MAEENKVYDWDDEITNDGEETFETVILEPGNYDFEVIKVEKGFFDGSDKTPACNMATAYLRIDGGEAGQGFCVERLYLCEKCEWRAAAFLRSIGLKKHDEPIPWRKIVQCDGEKGRCKIIKDEYTGRDGQKRTNNKVDRFFDKEEQPKKGFKRGAF